MMARKPPPGWSCCEHCEHSQHEEDDLYHADPCMVCQVEEGE